MKDLMVCVLTNGIDLRYKPIIGGEINLFIEKRVEGSRPVRFFTATNPMRDFIGNVTEVYGSKCSVEGVIHGRMQVARNVLIAEKEAGKVGARVMITEHINNNGELELLATKRRILYGDLNFINVGWSNDKHCYYHRIDIYTGDSREMTCGPVSGSIE